MSRFSQKVVIVTGAARGIGLAIAERFASEEASVVVADKDEEGGQRAADEINERGGTAKFVSCDVSERLDVMNLMASVAENFGRVDVLVNNAGINDSGDFLELDIADFRRVLDVNVIGPFLVSQAVARSFVSQIADGDPPGSIINIASINAHFALANRIGYSVSKGGLVSLTKAMALALAPHKIRVNAVAPGTIMTPMVADVAKNDELRRQVLSRTPLGRIGQPDEIAGVVAFLASDDASYITGETVVADGGRIPLNRTVPVEE